MSILRPRLTADFDRNVPEIRIWRAVIARTIQEWISGPLTRKREAEQYLFDDNGDFRLVCNSAGIDSGELRARLALLRRHAMPEHLLAVA
jgi:hypothetical protein